MARAADTYRGARRNREFGRRPTGNTKPKDRVRLPKQFYNSRKRR